SLRNQIFMTLHLVESFTRVARVATRARHAGRFRTPTSVASGVRKWLVRLPGAPYIGRMSTERKALYKALTARDARFDGVFFTGVTSTGIYCRPICPAKTPKESNCVFFRGPQEAEGAGFRPCLRCRPE